MSFVELGSGPMRCDLAALLRLDTLRYGVVGLGRCVMLSSVAAGYAPAALSCWDLFGSGAVRQMSPVRSWSVLRRCGMADGFRYGPTRCVAVGLLSCVVSGSYMVGAI